MRIVVIALLALVLIAVILGLGLVGASSSPGAAFYSPLLPVLSAGRILQDHGIIHRLRLVLIRCGILKNRFA
jgi:hypothetical protein